MGTEKEEEKAKKRKPRESRNAKSLALAEQDRTGRSEELRLNKNREGAREGEVEGEVEGEGGAKREERGARARERERGGDKGENPSGETMFNVHPSFVKNTFGPRAYPTEKAHQIGGIPPSP